MPFSVSRGQRGRNGTPGRIEGGFGKEVSIPKDIRAFVGLSGYYKKFIPRFSKTSVILTEATRKEAPDQVKWTAEMETAFEQLRASYCAQVSGQQ